MNPLSSQFSPSGRTLLANGFRGYMLIDHDSNKQFYKGVSSCLWHPHTDKDSVITQRKNSFYGRHQIVVSEGGGGAVEFVLDGSEVTQESFWLYASSSTLFAVNGRGNGTICFFG